MTYWLNDLDCVAEYDSPAVTSTVAGQKKPDDKLGKPATAAEDQYGSKYKDAQTRPSSQWPDENTGNRGVDTARPTGIGAAGVQVPKNKDGLFSSSGNRGAPGSESAGNFVHGEGGHLGDPKISSEKPAAMEEDPYTPNDQSKVADPTGTGKTTIHGFSISFMVQQFRIWYRRFELVFCFCIEKRYTM